MRSMNWKPNRTPPLGSCSIPTTRQVAWEFATQDAQRNAATYTNSDGTPNYRAAANDSFYDQMVIGVDRLMSVGAVLSTPVIDGHTLFFGSWDGQLYALE